MPGRETGAAQLLHRDCTDATEDAGDRSGAPGDQHTETATASTYVWFGLGAVVTTAFVVPVVVWRKMDGDEGFYAIATKLVAHGRAPYADFWFQQAPLLPYVYGAVDRIAGPSWYVLRGTSAVLTMLLAGAIAAHGLRRWRSPALAFLAVTLFISTPLVFVWDPTVKTYALSTLLLFGAYVAADVSSRRSWIVAGVLLGLAIDTRLLFVPVVIVFAVYARRHLINFVAGLVAGLVPLLLFFVVGPKRFVNDTVMSHNARSHLTLAENVTQKLHLMGDVLADPHVLFLVLGALGLVLSSLFANRGVPLAIAIGLTLAVASVFPTPSYTQYFVTLVPFLVIGAVDLVARWRLSNPSIAGIALLAVITGALVPIGVMPESTPELLVRGKRDVSAVRQTSAAVDAHARPGEEVLAFWPGYLYESHAQPMPGLESDFIAEAAVNTHLSTRLAHTYHMISVREIVDAIRSHRTRLIVCCDSALLDDRPWMTIIAGAGYRPIERLPLGTLYEYSEDWARDRGPGVVLH